MELVSSIVEGINNCIWGLPMIGPLFGTRLFLTFRTGFIQRRTFTGIRLSVTGPRIPLIGDQEVLPLLTTKQEGEHALHQPYSPSCLFSSPGLLFFTVLMVLTVLRNTAQYHYRGHDDDNGHKDCGQYQVARFVLNIHFFPPVLLFFSQDTMQRLQAHYTERRPPRQWSYVYFFTCILLIYIMLSPKCG